MDKIKVSIVENDTGLIVESQLFSLSAELFEEVIIMMFKRKLNNLYSETDIIMIEKVNEKDNNQLNFQGFL